MGSDLKSDPCAEFALYRHLRTVRNLLMMKLRHRVHLCLLLGGIVSVLYLHGVIVVDSTPLVVGPKDHGYSSRSAMHAWPVAARDIHDVVHWRDVPLVRKDVIVSETCLDTMARQELAPTSIIFHSVLFEMRGPSGCWQRGERVTGYNITQDNMVQGPAHARQESLSMDIETLREICNRNDCDISVVDAAWAPKTLCDEKPARAETVTIEPFALVTIADDGLTCDRFRAFTERFATSEETERIAAALDTREIIVVRTGAGQAVTTGPWVQTDKYFVLYEFFEVDVRNNRERDDLCGGPHQLPGDSSKELVEYVILQDETACGRPVLLDGMFVIGAPLGGNSELYTRAMVVYPKGYDSITKWDETLENFQKRSLQYSGMIDRRKHWRIHNPLSDSASSHLLRYGSDCFRITVREAQAQRAVCSNFDDYTWMLHQEIRHLEG